MKTTHILAHGGATHSKVAVCKSSHPSALNPDLKGPFSPDLLVLGGKIYLAPSHVLNMFLSKTGALPFIFLSGLKMFSCLNAIISAEF